MTPPESSQRDRASTTFVLISLTFGLLFSAITPPFQAPDEAAHFFRAYSIAQGQFLLQHQNGQSGAMLPVSLLESKAAFEPLIADASQTITRAKLREELRHPLDQGRRVFVDLSSTAVYSPMSHLAQSAGIGLTRLFDIPVLASLYAARIANVVATTLLIALAIRLLPLFGWGMALIGLLPMSVFLRASVSGDPITTALAFLVFALIVRLAWGEEEIGPRALAALLVTTLLLCLTKPIYCSILLLAPSIRRWPSRRASIGFYSALTATLVSGAVLFVLWVSTATPPASLSSAAEVQSRIDPGAQLALGVDQPLVVFRAVLTDYAIHADRYLAHFIGRLGWLDTPLPVALLGAYGLALLLVALTGGSSAVHIPVLARILATLALVTTLGAFSLAMYLVWTPVGASTVEGVQGRYFIPIAPVTLLIVANQRFAHKGWAAGWMPGTFVGFCVAGLAITSWVLVSRYYA